MPKGKLVPGDTNKLAALIRKALGVGNYDEVRVLLPQFDRTDGKKITWFPKSAADLDALKKAPKDIRKEIGMERWATVAEEVAERKERAKLYKKHKIRRPPLPRPSLPESGEIWLFPKEWYNYIPDGYEVISIVWDVEKFKRGKTDDDTRYGMLSFGVVCDE